MALVLRSEYEEHTIQKAGSTWSDKKEFADASIFKAYRRHSVPKDNSREALEMQMERDKFQDFKDIYIV